MDCPYLSIDTLCTSMSSPIILPGGFFTLEHDPSRISGHAANMEFGHVVENQFPSEYGLNTPLSVPESPVLSLFCQHLTFSSPMKITVPPSILFRIPINRLAATK